MFTCVVDGEDLATLCCACTFPLPCVCANCVQTHCSKPGNHCLLPLSVLDKIPTKKDFIRVQHRLQQLSLTYQELQGVRDTFQRAREEVESSYQALAFELRETKNNYLTRLNQTQAAYEAKLDEAMQLLYRNSWQGKDYHPSDTFAALISNHVPGETDFDLTYSVKINRELVSSLLQVEWSLPLPEKKINVRATQGQIFVRSLHGKTVTLDVALTDTIQAVKSKLQDKEGIPAAQQRLKWSSQILHDEQQTLDYYGLSLGCTLLLELQVAKGAPMIHVIGLEKRMSVAASPNSTIAEIKQLLQQQLDSDHVVTDLFWQDQRLADTCSLKQHGVSLGSCITAEISAVKPPG